MKKLTLLLIVVAVYAVSYAQTLPTKGDIYGGGCVNYDFTNSTDDDSKGDSYSLLPQVGYYMKDNLALGLGLGIKGESETEQLQVAAEDIDLTACQKMFFFSPFVRMHTAFKQSVGCFAEAGLDVGFGKEEQEEYDYFDSNVKTYETKLSQIGLWGRPGIWWQAKPKVALTFQYGKLYYQSTSYKPEQDGVDDYKVNAGGLSLDTKTAQVGVQYKF